MSVDVIRLKWEDRSLETLCGLDIGEVYGLRSDLWMHDLAINVAGSHGSHSTLDEAKTALLEAYKAHAKTVYGDDVRIEVVG